MAGGALGVSAFALLSPSWLAVWSFKPSVWVDNSLLF